MAHTLKPQDQIARYRVIGPIASGGMGEVYEARDRDLDRPVALKVLPRDLVRNEERVKRFVREAKSASSLSHPHIVTIYEIGQDRVRSEGGEAAPDAPPIHFISMELVQGRTLTDKIHHERTDLRTLLGYLAQAADGLAKAHAAGIVHRDLKPSNIMITVDGYAKVLDFGLAKLTEQEEREPAALPEGASAAATFAADPTSAGMVLGTAGYMAPEQVAGKPVDARADIFAFGCILHEAATRKRAFQADTAVETMHHILHEQPAPIHEINPEAPAALQRLIRRALTKDPEQRLQSMKDLAIELREIVTEYDSLGPSGITPSAGYAPVAGGGAARGRRALTPRRILMGAAGLAVVALAVLAGIRFRPGSDGGGEPVRATRPLEMTSILSRADLADMAISPDGRYLGFVSGPAGEQTLDILQISTGSTVRVLSPRSRPVNGLSFSPDGDFLYFCENDPDRPGFRSLFEVPSLGGTPTRRAFDVDTRVSFSPDGDRAAFWRNDPPERKARIILLELRSGREQVAYEQAYPVNFEGDPAWSPDGRHVAFIRIDDVESVEAGAQAMVLDLETGMAEPLGPAMAYINTVEWLPRLLPRTADLVLSANLRWTAPQVWILTYPGGEAHPITNEISAYVRVHSTANGFTICASRVGELANLWIQDVAAEEGTPLTFHSGQSAQVQSPVWGPGGGIVHRTTQGDHSTLWTIRPDGTGLRPLTKVQDPVTWDETPTLVPGGRHLLYTHGNEATGHVHRLDPESGESVPLTSGTPSWLLRDSAVSSRDGSFLAWRARRALVFPPGGGEPVPLDPVYNNVLGFSPDGRFILATRYDENQVRLHDAIPAGGGKAAHSLRLPSGYREAGWAPGSDAVSFTGEVDGVQGVFLQALAGGPPVLVARIAAGHIRDHRWSPDGTLVVFTVARGPAVNLWTAPGGGGEPRQLTRFPTGSVMEFAPSPDGRQVAFTYGSQNQDVVLIRDFR